MENDLTPKVKELWLSGLTGGQIGKLLGMTRGAVLGRIHRMRAAKQIGVREADERIYNIRAEVKRLEDEKTLTLSDVLREEPHEKETKIIKNEPVEDVLKIFIETDAPPKGEPITFDQLTRMSCRFVVNDGHPKDFLFCGERKNGRSYCKAHEALCYYKMDKRVKTNVNEAR